MTVNLRCANWAQLESIYEKDLKRSGFFMKSSNPPPLGTRIDITLTLPSGTTVPLSGEVREHVPPGGLEGRGPGLDLKLNPIPQTSMWLLETALQSARASNDAAPAAAAAAPAKSAEAVDLETGTDDADIERELCDALKQELASLKRFNPFQILGVGYVTTDEDVRDAFGKLSKRYHPDRFARYQSQEAKHLASEIFILIRDAYRRLLDTQAREKVAREIRRDRSDLNALPSASPPVPVAPPPAPPAAAAGSRPAMPPPMPPPLPPPTPSPAVAARGGLEMPSIALPEPVKAPMSPARENSASRKAIDLEAEVLLHKLDFDGASRVYGLQAKKNPADQQARAGLEFVEGMRALHKGEKMEAAQRLETALDLDPSNAMAASKLADMRRQATTERRGALTKLLQRKGEP